jgi:hypothetical protein
MLELLSSTSLRKTAAIALCIAANVFYSIWLSHQPGIGRILAFVQPVLLTMLMRTSYRSLVGLQRGVGLLVMSCAPYASIRATSLIDEIILGVIGGLSYWLFLPINREDEPKMSPAEHSS